MIRSSYILTVILLAGSIFVLFQIKFKVQNLHREMVELKQQLKYEKDNIHVLKAEWEYLNRPERLQRLTEKFLALRQVKAEQVMLAKADSIIIAENVVTTIATETSTNSQLIKVSYQSNNRTKWRYKPRPVLLQRRSK